MILIKKMTKKKIIKSIVVIFNVICSSLFLISCSNENKYLEENYIKKNFEDNIIFNLSKESKNIKIIKDINHFNFNEECIKKDNNKICEYIYTELYENFNNEHFKNENLFDEKKFLAEELLNKGFIDNNNINVNTKPMIPIVKKNNFTDLFKKIKPKINYEYYKNYLNKKIIPQIYRKLLIIEYLKSDKKYMFDTELQSYKINLISIPKKNNDDDYELLNLLEKFSIKYKNNTNFDMYTLNDLMSGLNSKIAQEYDLEELNDYYTLITNEVGQNNTNKNNQEEIFIYKGTLIEKLHNAIKNKEYKNQNIKLDKYQILEERKIRLTNFIKSDWYTKDNLDFDDDINDILKKNLFNYQVNSILKNKNSNNTNNANIKCFSKTQKCFYVHEAKKNDDNIVFTLKNNFYIIEIEDYFTSDHQNNEIYKVLKKTIDKNYLQYRKEAMEYYLKNKEIHIDVSKTMCKYFQQQYKNLTFKC